MAARGCRANASYVSALKMVNSLVKESSHEMEAKMLQSKISSAQLVKELQDTKADALQSKNTSIPTKHERLANQQSTDHCFTTSDRQITSLDQ